jgi:hypothetical protein
MRRVLGVGAVALFLASFGGPARAEEPHLSFLYSLPPDGSWVEFELDGVTLVSRAYGTMRMSSVGQKAIKGEPHRWIELKFDVTQEGKRNNKSKELTYVKLLVAAKAVKEGRALKGQIAEAYVKSGKDGVPSRIDQLATLGIREAPAKLRLVQEKEEISTKLGDFAARRLAFGMNDGDRPSEGADFWLSTDVPFGIVKAEVRSFGIFKFAAIRKGKDAKSELDVSKAKD